MKRIIFSCATALMIYGPLFSQVTKPAAKTAAAPKPVLKNLLDSASYAIGIYTVNSFKQYGITKINSAMVAKAIEDMLGNKKKLMDDNAANAAIGKYIGQLQAERVKPNIKAGETFLAANKKRPEVKTTVSGLQYEIITAGTGPVPKTGDSVICNYRGMFVNGTIFEESYKTGKPITFSINGVIPGWTEALLMMPVGSKWKLYIPYQRGYGVNDYMSIPGGSALIFELELLGIKAN